MTELNKTRMKIFQDEVKLKHTTHWDVDTMSRAEFEAYMQGELDLPSQNVYEVAATEAAARSQSPPAESQVGAVSPARTSDSLWDRFMKACLPRS